MFQHQRVKTTKKSAKHTPISMDHFCCARVAEHAIQLSDHGLNPAEETRNALMLTKDQGDLTRAAICAVFADVEQVLPIWAKYHSDMK